MKRPYSQMASNYGNSPEGLRSTPARRRSMRLAKRMKLDESSSSEELNAHQECRRHVERHLLQVSSKRKRRGREKSFAELLQEADATLEISRPRAKNTT